jgi:hypothetical protein
MRVCHVRLEDAKLKLSAIEKNIYQFPSYPTESREVEVYAALPLGVANACTPRPVVSVTLQSYGFLEMASNFDRYSFSRGRFTALSTLCWIFFGFFSRIVLSCKILLT